MSDEQIKPPEETSLRILPKSGLKLQSNPPPALAEIINRSLVHIQTSKTLSVRHRVGAYELCWPDYSLVCAWAEDLGLTPEETIRRLLIQAGISDGEWDTRIEDGRFRSLCVATSVFEEFVHMETLSVSSIPPIKGLAVEKLYLRLKNTPVGLDLSFFPNLMELECRDNQLTELGLSHVPNLTVLECGGNQLSELDLTHVPYLTELCCRSNQLTNLALFRATNLTRLSCSENPLTQLNLSYLANLTSLACLTNQLTELDLSHVPNLKTLSCMGNQLTELDLSHVPKLEMLWCFEKQLTTLDISNLQNLKQFGYDKDKTRLIQRPDQQKTPLPLF